MKALLLMLSVACCLPIAASAQEQTTRSVVRGTVTAREGNVLTGTAPAGPWKVTLADNVRVLQIVKSDLAKITPGTFVGAAATSLPDGSLKAIEVHIFPEAMRGTGEGNHPYDMGPTSSMTNATVKDVAAASVEGVSGQKLSVAYQGGEKTIVVTKDTPVVTYAPGDASMLKAGTHVFIFAVKHADGSLTTASVNVGKDGLVPPM